MAMPEARLILFRCLSMSLQCNYLVSLVGRTPRRRKTAGSSEGGAAKSKTGRCSTSDGTVAPRDTFGPQQQALPMETCGSSDMMDDSIFDFFNTDAMADDIFDMNIDSGPAITTNNPFANSLSQPMFDSDTTKQSKSPPVPAPNTSFTAPLPMTPR